MYRYGRNSTKKTLVQQKSTKIYSYRVEIALNEDLADVLQPLVNTHSRLRPLGIMNSSDFKRCKIWKFPEAEKEIWILCAFLSRSFTLFESPQNDRPLPY